MFLIKCQIKNKCLKYLAVLTLSIIADSSSKMKNNIQYLPLKFWQFKSLPYSSKIWTIRATCWYVYIKWELKSKQWRPLLDCLSLIWIYILLGYFVRIFRVNTTIPRTRPRVHETFDRTERMYWLGFLLAYWNVYLPLTKNKTFRFIIAMTHGAVLWACIGSVNAQILRQYFRCHINPLVHTVNEINWSLKTVQILIRRRRTRRLIRINTVCNCISNGQ